MAGAMWRRALPAQAGGHALHVMITVRAPSGGVRLLGDGPIGVEATRTLAAVANDTSTRVDEEYGAVAVPIGEPGSGGPLLGLTVGTLGFATAPPPTVSYAGIRRAGLAIRAEVDPVDIERLAGMKEVVAVHDDPPISPMVGAMQEPTTGDADDVRTALRLDELDERGLTGEGVDVAIVDCGVSLDTLVGTNLSPRTAPARSWIVPGRERAPFGPTTRAHGSITAAACLTVADEVTLLDLAALDPSPVAAQGLEHRLSDALAAIASVTTPREIDPSNRSPLVLVNSWGVDNPAADDGTGAQRYLDNPNHLFNEVLRDAVATLGVDIVFAAGNCGQPNPHYPWPAADPQIVGAGSLEHTLCIGAVGCDGRRTGYSAQGPGAIHPEKPDIMGYAHFSLPSGMECKGTSAAAPVVAGVIARLRSALPPTQVSPMALKKALLDTAVPTDGRAPGSHDRDDGFGIVEPRGAADVLGLP